MGLLKTIIKITTKPVLNNIKGKRGEKKVDSELNPLIFNKVEHRQINNLILVDSNNKTHQIDHVEIRENGIFCIETKNYKGWIFGNENQDKWTQTLYNEKHQFLNPLKQNKSHIYYLSQIIDKKYHINSLVVMVQNNADKINCSNVINLKDLKLYLKEFDDGTKLTIEEMDNIYNKLLNYNFEISDKEHIKNIKKTEEDIKNGICPRCKGKLVERKNKYGTFYGCNNYADCKFILKK